VHESTTIKDALHYIQSGWPSDILVTDAVISRNNQDSKRLLAAVASATHRGCTTILMGFFPSCVEPADLDQIFREGFGLRWESAMTAALDTILAAPDPNNIRTTKLTPIFRHEAAWLLTVAQSEAIYMATHGGTVLAHSAVGKVGLGKLGYIGDVNFTEEAERVILAMCHLDRGEKTL
jgi:hypothetical protein